MDRRTFLLQGGAIASAAVTTLAFPNIVKAGLDWLSSTQNGIDIYNGIVKDPTIFFNPNSTATKSLGTYEFPYKTQVDIQNAVRGNMSGQVLGIMRGTKLKVTGLKGLNFSVYGSAIDPFLICPYGDAVDLPIITSGTVVTWTLYDADYNIWSYVVGAIEQAVWRDEVRQFKATYTTSVQDSLIDSGMYTYQSNTLYLRLNPGESANDGNTEITVSDFSFLLNYDGNVASTGNLIVCGLDVRKARRSAFNCSPKMAGSITSINNIQVIGCRFSGGGVDNKQTLGRDGLVIYGISDSLRINELYIAGCYSYNNLNNAYELAGTSGALVEQNISFNCSGHSIIELWKSNDNCTVRYNWGDLSGLNRTQMQGAGGGIWLNNYDYNEKEDTTNTLNTNCKFVFNLITRCKQYGIRLNGGFGHVVQHNTFYADMDATDPDGAGYNQPIGWKTAGNAAIGFVNISNNLFYWKVPEKINRNIKMMAIMSAALGNANSVPSGNNNIYQYDVAGSKTSSFFYSKTTQFNFMTYKSAVSAYSLDQNSICTNRRIGGTLTESALGFILPASMPSPGVPGFSPNNAFTPLAAASAGLTSLTDIGSFYYDQTPYVPSSATIGALKGG